jgi:hypothetical protein
MEGDAMICPGCKRERGGFSTLPTHNVCLGGYECVLRALAFSRAREKVLRKALRRALWTIESDPVLAADSHTVVDAARAAIAGDAKETP